MSYLRIDSGYFLRFSYNYVNDLYIVVTKNFVSSWLIICMGGSEARLYSYNRKGCDNRNECLRHSKRIGMTRISELPTVLSSWSGCGFPATRKPLTCWCNAFANIKCTVKVTASLITSECCQKVVRGSLCMKFIAWKILHIDQTHVWPCIMLYHWLLTVYNQTDMLMRLAAK